MRRLLIAVPSLYVVLGFLLMLGGCGAERPTPKATTSQIGCYTDQFPDIPLPRFGYQLDAAHDQLAMAVAGGAVRRFDINMIQRDNAALQPAAELLAWYRRDLAETGWTLFEEGDDFQLWNKNNERLRLETGRRSGRTTLSFRLRPVLESSTLREHS